VRSIRLTEQPPTVRWGIYLLGADAIIGLLISLFTSGAWFLELDLVVAFFLALQIVQLALVFAVATGRRWAFIVYVLWFLWGVVHVSLDLRVYLDSGALNFGWIVTSLVIEGVGVALLLTPAARAWLESRQATRAGSEPAA
jgi:hypothetical protein